MQHVCLGIQYVKQILEAVVHLITRIRGDYIFVVIMGASKPRTFQYQTFSALGIITDLPFTLELCKQISTNCKEITGLLKLAPH